MLTSTHEAMNGTPVTGAKDKALRAGVTISRESIVALFAPKIDAKADTNTLQQFAAMLDASKPEDTRKVFAGSTAEEKTKAKAEKATDADKLLRLAPITRMFITTRGMEQSAAANLTSALRAIVKAHSLDWKIDPKQGYQKNLAAARKVLKTKQTGDKESAEKLAIAAEFLRLMDAHPKSDPKELQETATKTVKAKAETEKANRELQHLIEKAKEKGCVLLATKSTPTAIALFLLAQFGEKNLPKINEAITKQIKVTADQWEAKQKADKEKADADKVTAAEEIRQNVVVMSPPVIAGAELVQ